MTTFFRQMFVVSGVVLTMVATGMCLSITTFILPALQKPDSDIKADLSTSSWIAASFTIGWTIGFLTSAYYMNAFGRRIAFLLDVTPAVLGLAVTYFSKNVIGLIIARVLLGIAFSSTTSLGYIIIGEYTAPVHRGLFMNLKNTGIYMGTTITHLVGMYVHWRTVTLLTLVPLLFSFVIIWKWPESPAWLATKDQPVRCEKIFYWLRGKNESSKNELRDMLKAQNTNISPTIKNLSYKRKLIILYKKYTKRNFVMPIIIHVFAAILLESSGRHVFPSYAIQIITEVSGQECGTTLTTFTLYLDLLVTGSALFSCVLIKMFKRRSLLFVTGAAAFVILMLTCIYLYLISKSIVPNIPWLSIFMFGLYLVIVNFACIPIPLSLVGEIFPIENKAEGSFVAGLLVAFAAFIALKSTPILLVTLSAYITLIIFGVIMAMSLIVLYFILPETKDRTLTDIEKHFKRGIKNRKPLRTDDEEMDILS